MTELRNRRCREKILPALAEPERETINIGIGSQAKINHARWPVLGYT